MLPQADRTDENQGSDAGDEGVTPSDVVQLAFRFHHQPGRAEQGIADDHGKAGHHRKGRQPVEPAADIGAVGDLDALHQRAERDAL